MSSAWEWHDPDRAIRLATHALGLAATYIASEAGLKIWIERLYCVSVASLPPAPADEAAPFDRDDDLRGWPRIWKRAKRILAEGFRVVLLVGCVLAGVGTFAAFLIGVMWTNETVLSVIMGSMIFVTLIMAYDLTLGLIRPVQPPRDSISYTSKIPLIRLLAFPLLSPALAAATLSLFHMGTEAIFPLATFAWVTGALSRPPVFGNFTMRKTVSWIFFVSVVFPAVFFALIKLPSPFPERSSTTPAAPSPLEKLVPQETAPLSPWMIEFNKFAVQVHMPLLPGALIAACLRYDWTRSLPAGTTAEHAFTGLAPWQISIRARSRHTAPRPTFHAGLAGMLLGLILVNSVEIFISAEKMKRAQPLGMFVIPPFVLAAVCMSVWASGEWRVWWAYEENWEASIQVSGSDAATAEKPEHGEGSVASVAEKGEQSAP